MPRRAEFIFYQEHNGIPKHIYVHRFQCPEGLNSFSIIDAAKGALMVRLRFNAPKG